MVKDVAFVAYVVRDVPQAVAFYRDVLGLQSAFAVDGDPPPGSESAACTGLNFEVEDIVAARGDGNACTLHHRNGVAQ